MGTTPAKIIVRVILIAGLSAGAVGALGRGVLLGEGAARWASVVGLAFVIVVGAYLAWIYLPDVDLPGRSPSRGLPAPKDDPRIALTFDDGPNGVHTAAILDVL